MKRTFFATFLLLAALSTTAQAQQASPDWSAVEQALGRTGQMMPGDVYRIGMPRSDLQVTVQGVPIRPAFALGSYAAFKNMGDHTMVMGDLVLLDEEVNGVMSGLFAGGLQVTALHNHLNEMSPHVMYMHYMGMGDAVQLAGSIRSALSASGTPLGQPAAPPAPETGPQIDGPTVEGIMGRSGTSMAGGVFQVSVPRLEVITDMGQEIPPAMGVAMPFNFQPTGEGTSVVTGDYVLLSNEVNPVAQALRAAGIDVTAIHNHGLNDSPRLFYMHFWGNGETARLAQGLRSGLDQTSARGQAWTFDTNAGGTLPPGVEVFSGTWAVRAEPDAPSPPNALCQTGEAEFPALSLGPTVYKDIAVTTRFKPISGQIDQAAGIIFRVQDGQNYYILRANALENNVNFYTYIAGRRTSLAGGNVTVPSNQWQELRLEAVGTTFRGLLNGQPVVEASDSRFGMGRIGLWTKADSTTCFDAVTAAAP